MKHSIRWKLSAWVVGSMLALIVLGGILGSFFLEDYYLDRKINSLVDVYGELKSLVMNGGDLNNEKNRDMLNRSCEAKGITLFVINSDQSTAYAYGSADVMDRRMREILFASIIDDDDYDDEDVDEEDILESDDYEVDMVTDNGLDPVKHLEMSGELGDDQYFVMRVAVENIRESIQIAQKFYVFLSMVLVLIVTAVMLWITRKYTKPILQLAEISKQMSALNFNVRYEEKRDDEIGVLGESMNEMSKELESTISELKSANLELKKDNAKKAEINQMRSEFISNVSHELKTPIALIQGYAEGLKEEITDDPASMEFYCNVIIDEAAKMNSMVQNLLTLNQIEFEKDQIQMERFDIAALIRGVLNTQRLKAEQAGVTVIFDQTQPVYVWADEFQIEEVVTNYISNALNHVKEPNVIEVKIRNNGDLVRVSVFNTGDRIPEEAMPHIWEKFYKVDKARTREYGGNGIGLSIVKAVMERMGRECGALNLEDGVEFWFELDSGSKAEQNQGGGEKRT